MGPFFLAVCLTVFGFAFFAGLFAIIDITKEVFKR